MYESFYYKPIISLPYIFMGELIYKLVHVGELNIITHMIILRIYENDVNESFNYYAIPKRIFRFSFFLK